MFGEVFLKILCNLWITIVIYSNESVDHPLEAQERQ
jgi:hypothetical protein